MRRFGVAFACFVGAALVLCTAAPAKIKWDRVVTGVATVNGPLVPGQTATLTISGMPVRAPIRGVSVSSPHCPQYYACEPNFYPLLASTSDQGEAQLQFVVNGTYFATTYYPG